MMDEVPERHWTGVACHSGRDAAGVRHLPCFFLGGGKRGDGVVVKGV